MTAKRSPTKIDPELTTQLDAADPDDAPVQAVVYLRSGSKGGPAAVSKRADQVIASASTKAGTEPSRVNVMRYLGTVAIEAPASFVRALLDEDDIESALANVHPGDDDPGLGRPSATSESSGESPALDPSAARLAGVRAAGRAVETQGVGAQVVGAEVLDALVVERRDRVADRLGDVGQRGEPGPVARLVGDRQRVERHRLEERR